ncbi:hypothetical protein HELRODRAFT_186534 [Helobdella robusta]|uniref:Exocyst complex component Sec8 n=1 Tax=Helobdella robusta TaxID=6412 RepID=T1FP08_HELRO|nr:hypothetical protein HELRODRAFT_186534 [Helobdella robusta]ESN96349.1 hypothetical protein HELRODRAFT_186534 [Helobdella robusta]
MSKDTKDAKTPSEAAGLLMSIVRALSSSANVQQRDDEKIRLEKAFKESDRKLDNMITDHLTDLTSIIQAFSKISSRISCSQEKIKLVKENLLSCKNLLHCKRDELRRLWVEGIQYKTVSSMMDEVENIKNVHDKLRKHLESRHYLSFTTLLMSSLEMLNNDLSCVEGLKDIKNELVSKKDELYNKLTEELDNLIYVKSTLGVVKHFQRQGSQRQSKSKPQLKSGLKSKEIIEDDSIIQDDNAIKLLMNVDTKSVSDSTEPVTEDINNSPDSNIVNFISILIESLAKLNRMPDAVEYLKRRMGPGLVAIVRRASQQVADYAYVEGEELSQLQQPQYLLEMLELIFKQFHVVSKVHEILLANMRRIKNVKSSQGDFNLYDIMDLWSKIQSVMQSLLCSYLDVDESASRLSSSPNDRCPENITAIYNSLKSFLAEAEKTTKVAHGSLSLQAYIKEFVEGVFLIRVQNEADMIISQAAKSPEMKKKLADQHTQRAFSLVKPILQSSVIVAELLQNTCTLMRDLPDYSSKFMNLICKSLQEYLNVCQASYKECINPELEEKKVMSALWMKDDDISRFLRSLPNFLDLKKVSVSDEEQTQISDEDLRAMNAKESTVLTNNLLTGNESNVLFNEIISDTAILRTLGNLCESMEWFSSRIKDFSNGLESGTGARFIVSATDSAKQIPDGSSHYQVNKDTLVALKSLSRHYEDLSEVCLLVLHLEARVHCFHHLLRIPKSDYCGVIDKLEPDENVLRLNKDLISLEEVMSQSLQQPKFSYVFQGLGHLISTILVGSAQVLKRINENGVKKMCRNVHAVQQCLSNITGNREPDLDHARQFYELLYLSPDEVMKACFERGKQFTEHEYTILLQLNHRSTTGSTEADLNVRLKKLASILADSSL